MTSVYPVCVSCAHFAPRGPSTVCEAFPAGIPDQILERRDPHLLPRKGDHGIQFDYGAPAWRATSPEVTNAQYRKGPLAALSTLIRGSTSSTKGASMDRFARVVPFALPETPDRIDDEFVLRSGKVFEAGDYPDKEFSMTPEELAAAVEAFEPCDVDLEHTDTVLSGKLGRLEAAWLSEDGRSMLGTVRLPKWLDDRLADTERKVSATWDRATKHIQGLALVLSPRVPDAALMSAYAAFAAKSAAKSAEAAAESVAAFVTKKEDGGNFPASDYAYVPDPTEPSTWKLRLTSTPGGAPDPGIVGAAAAALGPGFRGQKVQIPAADRPAVVAKVRGAWRRANPDKSDDQMPEGIRPSSVKASTTEPVTETAPEFARHDTPTGQIALQRIHDTAAGAGAVCSPPANMASKHEASTIQQIHDMAASHGATCAGMKAGDSASNYPMAMYATAETPATSTAAAMADTTTPPKEGRTMSWKDKLLAMIQGMPDDEDSPAAPSPAPAPAQTPTTASTPATATYSATAQAQAAELAELNRLAEAQRGRAEAAEAENRRLIAERIQERAVTFADKAIAEYRAFPSEREAIIADYIQRATDDSLYGVVKMSEGKTTTRVALKEAEMASREPHKLTAEQITPALMSILQGNRETPAQDAGDRQATPEEVRKLIAMTPAGAAFINEAHRDAPSANGRS